MKVKIDIVDNFIDVWNEEKEIWERYVKIELEEEPQEHKIPEKMNYPHIEIESNADDEIRDYLYKVKDKVDEILDYLEKRNDNNSN